MSRMVDGGIMGMSCDKEIRLALCPALVRPGLDWCVHSSVRVEKALCESAFSIHSYRAVRELFLI